MSDSLLVTPRTFRLMLSYDGTAYAGWQIQPDAPTVQGLIRTAARTLCGPDARVTGASRTDAGVHALRQVASLTTRTSTLTPAAILGALNAALPRDVRVLDVREVEPGFDARRAARVKRYLYLIDNGRVPSPLFLRYAWHVPAPLDVAAMRTGLAPLRGRHDFSAFRAAAGRDRDPTCVVSGLHVLRRRERILVAISADRYLHHMVRVIVGSAVEVGRGARPPSWIAAVRDGRDRTLAGPTAPARGLALVRVVY